MEHLALPTADTLHWVTLHGQQLPQHHAIRFEARCLELTEAGYCGIYEARPHVCQVFAVGGQDCFDAVRRRRSADDYTRIRDADDPLVVHD
jgi:hypothetical protein